MKEELLKRTFVVSQKAINLTKMLPRNVPNQVIKKQFLRAITSIGANYREAIEAESRKDFVHKLQICKKEAREALYWIGLIQYHNPTGKNLSRFIISELRELIMIFSKSIKTAKTKMANDK